MAATSFRSRSHADTARLDYLAGGLITVLDDLLNTGTNPWSRTENATNDITYTAPAGSQIKLRVYDTVNHTTSFVTKVEGQIGSGAVFPTATQAAAQGMVHIKDRGNTNTGDTYDPDWWGIRTDRFAILAVGRGTAAVAPGALFFCGDLPTFDGSDPGLCVVSGWIGTSSTNTTVATDTSLTGRLASSYTQATGIIGYANVASDGTTASSPLFFWPQLPANCMATSAVAFTRMQLGRVLVSSSTNTAATTPVASTCVMRGYVPYLYVTPTDPTAQNHGDTFTDSNGASYVIIKAGSTAPQYCLMTSDGEALP